MDEYGTLYVVATPIGNLNDMTPRAVETLKAVDCILVEDTRHSGRLLQHFAIDTPMLSYHEHNAAERAQEVMRRLEQGASFALISDAGTPLISDPGYRLVHAARDAAVTVVPIPGACAAIAALSVSGLPTDHFEFVGFLPAKTVARKKRLAPFKACAHTLIFYVSTHRVLSVLEDMIDVLGGERSTVLARELTKLFETVHSGSLADVKAWILEDAKHKKGEFVLLLGGVKASTTDAVDDEAKRVLDILSGELSEKQAVELTAKLTGARKNKLKKHLIDG